MISGENGVTVTRERSWTGFAIAETSYDLCWRTEPGWVTLQVDEPTLCIVAGEVGGRCEFRARPDQLPNAGYFASDALAFVAPGAQVAIYAAKMRKARIGCFGVRLNDVDYLSTPEITAVAMLQSRYMYHNKRIRTCALLLDGERVREGHTLAYLRSLSRALLGAILELTHEAPAAPAGAILGGAGWDRVSRYMREHLREPITIEALARVAQMPPEQFGTAFRRATGMSLRQWQMDERVRGAQWLMTDKPGRSLAEIADVCGFSDQSHFSRSFLKMVGLTPTGWLHSLT